jgi:hypothetical protein
MNILIKLMSIVSLVIAPTLAQLESEKMPPPPPPVSQPGGMLKNYPGNYFQWQKAAIVKKAPNC